MYDLYSHVNKGNQNLEVSLKNILFSEIRSEVLTFMSYFVDLRFQCLTLVRSNWFKNVSFIIELGKKLVCVDMIKTQYVWVTLIYLSSV